MVRATRTNVITCSFAVPGDWAAGKHTGIDFRAAVGTPIFCTYPGKVIYEGEGGGGGPAYGKHIIIQSYYRGDTIRHLYAHLDKSWVNEGERIKAGDEIGESGETGRTFGAHLHYEERRSPFGYWNFSRPVLLDWRPLNPFLRRKITRNIDASR